jgi:hypothetical protein
MVSMHYQMVFKWLISTQQLGPAHPKLQFTTDTLIPYNYSSIIQYIPPLESSPWALGLPAIKPALVSALSTAGDLAVAIGFCAVVQLRQLGPWRAIWVTIDCNQGELIPKI